MAATRGTGFRRSARARVSVFGFMCVCVCTLNYCEIVNEPVTQAPSGHCDFTENYYITLREGRRRVSHHFISGV